MRASISRSEARRPAAGRGARGTAGPAPLPGWSKRRWRLVAVLGLLAAPALGAAGTSAEMPAIRIEMQLARAEATDRPGVSVPGGRGFAEVQSILELGSLRPLPALAVEAVPGETIERGLGGGYRLAFHLGSPDRDGRIALTGFELSRERGAQTSSLLRADLRPWLNRPLVLGLTRSESGRRAVLLRLTCLSQNVKAP